MQKISKWFKMLTISERWLMNQGILNLYLDISKEKRRAFEKNVKFEEAICNTILQLLEPSLKYYFMMKEINKLKKKHWLISEPNQHTSSKTMPASIECRIKEKYMKKNCLELFKTYLKRQESKIEKQACRICLKEIKIK